ncbi:hypothetical protein BHM03_00060221 [Ensete ventricosum]|nr:hypothetical protein BHM03_00060221 [Ensete ventricosum]
MPGLVAHSSGALQSDDVSPPPTAVVQQPLLLAPTGVPAADDAFFTREVDAPVMSDTTDTATSTTIPKASPSGLVDVLLIPDEVSLSSSSIDFEKMYCTDDHPFFTSLEEFHALLMSDDTFRGRSPTLPSLLMSVENIVRSCIFHNNARERE